MPRESFLQWNSGNTLLVGRRFMWSAPWGLSSPFIPRLWRGGDELGNPSLCLTIPFLGAFIVFYSPVLREDPAVGGQSSR